MIDFIIWALMGCLVIGKGIQCLRSGETVGFYKYRRWQTQKTFEVTDVRGYNLATGKLFCVCGVLFVLLGIPLLDEQTSQLDLIPVVGVLPWGILWEIIYELVICRKYQKK